jgi:hypothetical protein
MTRGRFLTAVVAAAVAVGGTPAFAQRSGGGGESTGTAVSRSGGDVGATSGSVVSSSGSSTSDSGSSTSATPSRSAPSPAPRAAERQRRPSGESRDTGSRAVPRGSGGSGGTESTASGGRTSGTASAETSGQPRRAVPATSRAGDGRPRIGTAVERRPGLSGQPGTIITYYPRGRYFWPGYGFGLSYFYDPFWYDPFGYGYYGYGMPYGYSGYAGGYGGTYRPDRDRSATGSLRLRVSPSHAEVYVDGYYAGTVNDFNGIFQRLTIEAGARRIEIRADGYKPAELDILVEPGRTAIYQGELEPLP